MHSVALNRKEDEIISMKRSLQNKDTEIRSLESKLIDAKKAQIAIPETSEYQRLHGETEKLKKEKSTLEKLLEDSRKRYTLQDSKDNEQLQGELQNTRTENQSYRHRISTLEQENASAVARYERAESKIRNIQSEVLGKQSEIQTLQERIRHKETENNTLQQDFSEILKERDRALERKDDLEKELYNKNQNLQENLNQLRSELTKCQEENARSASKIYEKTDHELNIKRTEEQRLLKRNSQLEGENSKLREGIEVISKEKNEALTRIRKVEAELKISNVEVQQKMKAFQELQERILQKEEETKLLQKELSEISKGKERKNDFEQENRRLREGYNKLHAENEIFEEKITSTSKTLEETEKQLKSMKLETCKLQDRVTQLSTENNQLREDIAEVSKEKDNALTRLSKVAGAKVTHGNAAITDLSDTNRPTKIAEKFSELYDNQWTDAFEELDNTYNNEEETIQVLLKILKEAYDFCVRTEKNYETRIGQAVFTLADEKSRETRQIIGADVPVQKALTDLRLSLGNACCLIVEEMFLARLPSFLKKVDVSVSSKTKLYARQCASLCWRMSIRDPPIFVRFEFRRGTEFNTDILRRYTKTGGYVDFIVWPALYLHESGPVLSKGVAQPKHTP
ncbi:girdin-like [Saccostrea echinata]|uniref:girdin-like n=1 Tax=Saccostrea echinata TaxID=191078 RepID=UPI002A7F1014|nr:girdin-like [Saccostrea echinata]